MKEPVHFHPRHDKELAIYQGGELRVVIPHRLQSALIYEAIKIHRFGALAAEDEEEKPPASLASNLRAAHALAAAAEGPHKTIITTALSQALQALGEAP